MTIHSIIANDLDYYYYSTVLLLRDSLIIDSEYTCLHPIHSWKHHVMGSLRIASVHLEHRLVLQMGLLVLSCFTYPLPYQLD